MNGNDTILPPDEDDEFDGGYVHGLDDDFL